MSNAFACTCSFSVRILLVIAATIAPGLHRAFADNWIQPTTEELRMTAEPAVPGAAAIYLYRSETVDDKFHIHTLYVRIKILTEKGVEQYGDVELNYDQGHNFSIRAIEGRTIHSDGTIIPFSGKPYEKVLEKSKTLQYKAKVFSLPDVQVGSILEYRYVLSYDDNLVVSPQWYMQLPLYIRKGHYEFVPTEHELVDEHGSGMQASVSYARLLPSGVDVKYSPTQKMYTVDVQAIEPIPEEEFTPPMRSISYRVLFYYTASRTAEDYWKYEGKFWSRGIDKFMSPGKLTGIVSQIVAPADTPRQKAQKIYDAVMKLDNTSFTREHSGAENKAEGTKTKTAEDIWNAKRGNSDELTILFVGLARASGLKAYVASVTNRDNAFLIPAYLSMSQLDDDIAIVELDGKDAFFDPGERYCASSDLHWKHSMTDGLRQTESGTSIVHTPMPVYKSTSVFRIADIQVEPDGKVHGTVRITMTGAEALAWRQRLIRTDEDQIKKEFENSVQEDVPAGVQVKANHFLALTDYDKPLMAVLDVSGSMGTATSKRVFLPTMFFEAGAKPLFVHDKRVAPVDLNYPYGEKDSVIVRLPASLVIESAPKNTAIPLPKNAVYETTFKQEPGKLEATRVLILANAIYTVDEYPALKDFFQKVNAKDQEQAVLQPAAAGAAQQPSGGGAQ